jgi:thiazole/oxazole-forming peptide maturase SagC family component
MESTDRPRIRRFYSRVTHTPDIVELRCGVWNPVSLNFKDDKAEGKLSTIIALLDGTRTIGEIARGAECPLSTIYGVIEQLQFVDALEKEAESALDAYLDQLVPAFQNRRAGSPRPRLLVLGDAWFIHSITNLLSSSLPDAEFCSLSPEQTRLLETTRLSSLNDDIPSSPLFRSLAAYTDSFVIFGSQHIDPVKMHVLNRILVVHRIPALYVVMDGPFLLIGPTVLPGRTSCFECFEKRVQMNLRENANYVAYKDALVAGSVELGTPPFAEALKMLLASHAALETINFVSTGSSFTRNKVLSIYLPTMEFAFNEVLRLPDCGACSRNTAIEHTELHFDLYALLASRR